MERILFVLRALMKYSGVFMRLGKGFLRIMLGILWIFCVNLYGMEEKGALNESFLPNRSSPTSGSSKMEVLLGELRAAIWEEERERKEGVKRARAIVGNTKKEIIRDSMNFLAQLEGELSTEHLDISRIRELLDAQKHYWAFLCQLNSTSEESEEEEGQAETSQNSEKELTTELDEDEDSENSLASLEDALKWSLPENTKMWLNQGLEEENWNWKYQFFRRARESAKEHLDEKKMEALSFQMVQYCIGKGKIAQGWSKKEDALYAGALLAKDYGWNVLSQELFEEIISLKLKANESEVYEKYKEENLTFFEIEQKLMYNVPLHNTSHVLDKVDDREQRKKLARLVCKALYKNAEKTTVLTWKCQFLGMAAFTIRSLDGELGNFYLDDLRKISFLLIKRLFTEFGKDGLETMEWYFNWIVSGFGPEIKDYDSLVSQAKEIYISYFIDNPTLHTSKELGDDKKIILLEGCLYQDQEVEALSRDFDPALYTSFDSRYLRALEICEHLSDDNNRRDQTIKVLDHYAHAYKHLNKLFVESAELKEKIREALTYLKENALHTQVIANLVAGYTARGISARVEDVSQLMS